MKRLTNFPVSIVRQNAKFYNKSFHAKLFTLFASSVSELVAFNQSAPVAYSLCFALLKKDRGEWFLGEDDIGRVRAWVLAGARNNSSQVGRLYESWHQSFNDYQACCRRLSKVDFKTLSDAQLNREFKVFYQKYLRAGGIAYMADSFMSTGDTDWLVELVKEELTKAWFKGDKNLAARTLTMPSHQSYSRGEEIDLLKIAARVKKSFGTRIPGFDDIRGRPKLFSLFSIHAKKYYWLNNNYYNVELLGKRYFYSRIAAILRASRQQSDSPLRQLARIKLESERIKLEKKKILSQIRLPRFCRNVLAIAELFAGWKDIRKSGVYVGMRWICEFLKEISARSKYSYRDLNFLTFDEVAAAWRSKKDFGEEIKARRQQAFFAVTTGGYFIRGGNRAKKYLAAALRARTQSTTVVWRGVSASPGAAKGKVRLILKTRDMARFRRGEILVTNQTTPEFVPIMKNAGAIITEQGGITSHAAVIARELGKPCVIGVKDITHFLKTGTRVRVDAAIGVVEKL